ncbi:Cytochrome P450 76T24 [Camellia lanceoleosa]|uniref:Cytochrome P450 76T24 n=1 Tax=Camellia lanceoleosa TaxID=1840588 RepID=A0ACC0IR21_9ERIC|nr:Cytochrome P450 76T24 [Camellia lanceoleosa]
MDYLTLALVLFFVWACFHVFWFSSAGKKPGPTLLPPGPNPFPIIGNILALGKRPHESLSNLSKIYGPLMYLMLGTIKTIVVSSPSIAKEVLQKHDQVCSSRTIPHTGQVFDHDKVSMVWLPVSSPWRSLRKIYKEHMFSTHCLDVGQGLRQKKVQELLDYVKLNCDNGREVDIGKAAFTTTLNLLSNTFFSIDMTHHSSDSSQEFKGLVWTIMELAGKPNLSDYFPLLRFIDPQGMHLQMKRCVQRLFDIFDGIINQRLHSRVSVSSPTTGDLLDVLLNLEKENGTQLSSSDIKHFLLSSSAGRSGLPPGPNPFPIIGNILALGKRPHESLSNLSKIYGPLMSLKLGTMTTIVVSSPSIAKQVLQKHDQIFSGRTLPNVVQVLNHHKASIVWSSALSPWRNLRKICKEHVFSTRCLDANQGLRQKQVQELLDYVKLRCENGQEVDIGKAAFTTTLNLLSNTFFSIDMAHLNSIFSQEFKDLVWALMEIAGKPNIADYLPLLKLIDPEGLQGQTKRYIQRLFDIFDGIINQRLQLRASVSSPTIDDFLEVLLNLRKENDTRLSCDDIKHLFLDTRLKFYTNLAKLILS